MSYPYNEKNVNQRFFLIFFFQAEDGIRDTSVTGVQTCALPIFGRDPWELLRALAAELGEPEPGRLERQVGPVALPDRRSEERRVGKECRTRRAADHGKKREVRGRLNATPIIEISCIVCRYSKRR